MHGLKLAAYVLNCLAVVSNGYAWITKLPNPVYSDQISTIIGLSMLALLLFVEKPNDRKNIR